MDAEARAERDASTLELRRTGYTIPQIRAELGYSTAEAVELAIARALKAQGTVFDVADVRALELDRLDKLQQVVWTEALGGDLKAIELATKLGEIRVRLAGVAARGESVMTDAYDKTVAALDTEDVDASLLASGRRVAEQIDTAAASGDAMAETKALYLLPHLMNILRELGATPAARAELKAQAGNGSNEKRARLRSLQGKAAG